MKLTKFGLPQAAVFPSSIAAAGTLLVVFLPGLWKIPAAAVFAIILIWSLSFFRDPKRKIIPDENAFYSPCDGTVTEITQDGNAVKISMFLSLFNVHINRAPCSGTVREIIYKQGSYLDARNVKSAAENERNDIIFTRSCTPADTFTVRQVSGAVARHIVCAVSAGDTLAQGQQLGMIKFGSRTELTLCTDAKYEIRAAVGDKVKAGLTVLIRYI